MKQSHCFYLYQCKIGVIELKKANVSLVSSNLLSKNIKIKLCRTVILPAILCGCETLREKHRLRVFENRVLRGISGAKSEEVKGGMEKNE
jgi:hypothetical protein